jgi:hypothetical protein
MLLNILKTPTDLQLSKSSKEPTHISKSIYYLFFFLYSSIIRFCCKFDFELSLFIYESSTSQLELTPINIKY